MKMEYGDITMNTRTNTETYRCSYKGFKWSKHSQNVSFPFLQCIGREMYYSLEWEFCVPVVHFFHILKSFSFSVFIRNVHCTSRKNQAYIRLACRTYVRTHHKTLSFLLLCCIFEGSKNHDPKRKLRYTSIVNPWPVQYWVWDVIEQVYRVISPGISHVVCKTSWLKRHSRWFGCLFSIFTMLLRMLFIENTNQTFDLWWD